jgi:hypothetical protein
VDGAVLQTRRAPNTDKRGFLTKAAAEAWLQGAEVSKRKGEFIDLSREDTNRGAVRAVVRQQD